MASEIILNPGGGKKVLFLGNEMVLKVVSRDTGGVFSLCEFTMQAGFGGPPPHIHHSHEETFFVLEGPMRFRIDGRGHRLKVWPGISHRHPRPPRNVASRRHCPRDPEFRHCHRPDRAGR